MGADDAVEWMDIWGRKWAWSDGGFGAAVRTVDFGALWALLGNLLGAGDCAEEAEATPASSPLQTIKNALSKPSTIRILSTYVACTTIAMTLHVFMPSTNEPGSHLNIFVKSKKHPYYLNGRLVFVFLSQIVFAVAFFLRNIMFDRFSVHWNNSKQTVKADAATEYTRQVFKVGVISSVFTSVIFAAYLVAFGLVRSVALPILFKVPVVSMLLRPICAHFLRGSWTVALLPRHFTLVWRTYLLGLTTVASWEFAESLFDEKIQEPISVSHHTPDPAVTLVSGIHSQDVYYKFFAYWELREFATDDSEGARARRTAMFSDQKYSPPLWSALARESLLFLGKNYQLLLRRGKPAPAPPPPPAKPKGPQAPSTPLVRKPIFRSEASQSPLRTIVDAVAADGALTQMVESSVETTATHLPELFKAIESPVAKAKSVVAKSETVVKSMAPPAKSRDLVARLAPHFVAVVVRRAADWWQRERIGKLAEIALPHRHIDALVVEALSHLVCASLTEDRYGVVQRDIPRILEAMLSFLKAIEEYQAELAARAVDVLAVVDNALKEGVVRIVRTFGNRLSAFKFPSHIAQKLQGFVDYH
ncbi:hypothetical protein EWM64_g7713 [Hericium alpestre]|uniref:Nucleoporin protein Ndc1-Nup n=1 Tax=Hericium alpestre TaxID=135208 RepID=A0A4Y9ZQG6_9AGAM|nr:hypothetical protein EWM64_g7713 [Hericium alpestre]